MQNTEHISVSKQASKQNNEAGLKEMGKRKAGRTRKVAVNKKGHKYGESEKGKQEYIAISKEGNKQD